MSEAIGTAALLTVLADGASTLPAVDPLTAAIIAGGSLVYALILQKRDRTGGTEPAPAHCDCAKQIRETEDRVKLHIDAIEQTLTAKLEATHKHVAHIPDLRTVVEVIRDRLPR